MAATASRSRGARVLRALVYCLAALFALLAVVVGAGLVVSRTSWGRKQLLALTLPRLQASLGGKLTVSRLEGDLLKTLIVYDFALDDDEGNPAIRARRVEAHFDLLSLVSGAKRIEELHGEGVWLALHMLADDRFNLATLGAPREPGQTSSKGFGGKTQFVIEHAVLEARLRYQSPSAPPPLRVVEAAVQVEGAIEIGEKVVIALSRVDGVIEPPLAAPLHARGRLVVANGELTLEGVSAEVDLNEAALHRLFPPSPRAPSLEALGPAELGIHIEGPVNPIVIAAHTAFPSALAVVDGQVTIGKLGIAWKAAMEASGTSVKSTGSFDWLGHGEIAAQVSSTDLSGLSEGERPLMAVLGGPKVLGVADGSATLTRTDQGVTVKGEVRAAPFAVPSMALFVGRLGGNIDSSPAGAGLALTAANVRAGPVDFAAISLGARGTSSEVTVEGKASVGGQTWQTAGPAHLKMGRSIQVDGLRMTSRGQRLTLDGRYDRDTGGVEAAVTGQSLDLRPLAGRSALAAHLPASCLRLDARVRGMAKDPTVDARVAGYSLATAELPRVDLTAFAHYGAGRVVARADATEGGQHLHARISAPLRAAGGSALSGESEVDLVFGPRHDDALLQFLPDALRRFEGKITLVLGLAGTLRLPRLAARVQLASPVLKGIAANASGSLVAGQIAAEAAVWVRGAELVTLRAGMDLGSMKELGNWRKAAVHVDGTLPGYSLVLVPELAERVAGLVTGDVSLRGSVDQPVATAHLRVANLVTGGVRFSRLSAVGAYDRAHAGVTLDGAAGTGTLHVAATLPSGPGGPGHLAAKLVQFPLDLKSSEIPGLHTLQGTVNADVVVDGPLGTPTLSGFVRIADGVASFGDGSLVYDRGAVDVSVDQGKITLKTLNVHVADGSLEASGTGKLAGLIPTALDAEGVIKNYPVSANGVSAWLDARMKVELHQGPDGLVGRVGVTEGQVQLASLSRAKSVQSTAAVPGVRFVDAAGQRAAAVAQAKKAARKTLARASESEAPDAVIALSVPGPFLVKGREVETALKGEVSIAVLGSLPLVSGTVESSGGWVELLGRRYELELAKVDFDGAAEMDPQLDVRVARTTDVTLVVEVQGPASRPTVTFSSRPPVYSAEQVMTMILSQNSSAGDNGAQAMDGQVAGALSGELVGQLKDQLLPGLPVDVVKVNLDKDTLGGEDTRMEVGKYITESLYLSYVHQLSAPNGLRRLNNNQLQLEYRFAQRYKLRSSFGDNGVGALDFYWSWRF